MKEEEKKNVEKKRRRNILIFDVIIILCIIAGSVFWTRKTPDGRTRFQKILDKYYGRTPVEMRM